ncbi:MAG: ferritin [Gammaproteobacteria bacterium]|nr:MAG: ferritin [Gammaproteobacteria bacterium]
MRIHESVTDIIKAQVNHELHAAYSYLGMAAYFDSQDLAGFALWFRGHAREEISHAMRLYDFLVSCDVPVELQAMSAPATVFDSPRSAIEAGLEQEQQVTEQIKNMFEVAHEAKEYTTQPMLHWFLAEQVEEEDLFRKVLNDVEAAGSSDFHMLQLDKQMAQLAAADGSGDGEGEIA